MNFSTSGESWCLSGGARFDTEAEYGKFTDSTIVSAQLIGEYDYNSVLSMQLGGAIRYGMEDSRFYPIVGMVYWPTPCWRFAAVFPTDISVEYRMTEITTLGIQGFYHLERHRVSHFELLESAIWEWESTGIEVYFLNSHKGWDVKLAVGHTLDANIDIFDRRGHSVWDLSLDNGPYINASISYAF